MTVLKIETISERSLGAACKLLSGIDPIFTVVHNAYGKPPLWGREPGFATLLQIILEQQVSLASAKACFDKLAGRIGSVTPDRVLGLSDAELKAIGFSRQKTSYARHLSEAVLEGRIHLEGLAQLSDPEVKVELTRLKGIGEWTSDIYLLMALLRPDVMPKGDIALHAAYQKLAGLRSRPDAREFIEIAERWKPFRSVAARLLWHFYLSEKRNSTGKRT